MALKIVGNKKIRKVGIITNDKYSSRTVVIDVFLSFN
jgi:hypothetical protein